MNKVTQYHHINGEGNEGCSFHVAIAIALEAFGELGETFDSSSIEHISALDSDMLDPSDVGSILAVWLTNPNVCVILWGKGQPVPQAREDAPARAGSKPRWVVVCAFDRDLDTIEIPYQTSLSDITGIGPDVYVWEPDDMTYLDLLDWHEADAIRALPAAYTTDIKAGDTDATIATPIPTPDDEDSDDDEG